MKENFTIDRNTKFKDFEKALQDMSDQLKKIKQASDIKVKDPVYLKPLPELITRTEAGRHCGKHIQTINKDIKYGRIKEHIRGDRSYVDKNELEAFYGIKQSK